MKTHFMVAIFVAFAFAGCTAAFEMLTRDVRVRIVLPEANPAVSTLFPQSCEAWSIRWYDSSGKVQSLRVEGSARGSEVEITLEAGIFTPIIAIPEITDSESILFAQEVLPLAGGLFPLHAEGSPGRTSLRLDRIRALSAECAKRTMLCAAGGIYTGRRIAEAFNWMRFESLVSELAYPGRLDQGRVVTALLGGTMRASSIRESPAVSVTFSLPPELALASEAILWPADSANEILPISVEAVSLVLCDALHQWFNAEGILSVQVREGTVVSAFFTSFPLR
jgi:hypothetical protein